MFVIKVQIGNSVKSYCRPSTNRKRLVALANSLIRTRRYRSVRVVEISRK